MVNKENKFIDSESEVWNIAKGFTNLSVLALLVEVNNLVKTARFGCERLSDKPLLTDYQITANRIEALARIEDNLRQIYENTYFILKKTDKEKMDTIILELDKIRKVFDAITSVETDPSTRTPIEIINESHFNLCLNELRKAKREMHLPLNNAQLIFPTSDELDFSKIEEELIHGG